MSTSILVRDSDDCSEFDFDSDTPNEHPYPELSSKDPEAAEKTETKSVAESTPQQDDDDSIPSRMQNNHVDLKKPSSHKKLIMHCLLTAQTGCFFILTLFYSSLALGRPGPHINTLDEHNNLNSLLQMFESWAVDAVTVLFVVSGCLDHARIHDTSITPLNNLYQINILTLPIMTLINYLSIPIGMFMTGTYSSLLSWIINLSTPLLLSPFFEYDQISRARLFNEPTAVMMTLLLCRSLFHLARFTMESTKKAIPEHHEILNLIIILFQTITGCIITSWSQNDNHFYYSFRFAMTRFSEYSLGVMCFEYLYLNKTPGIFQKLSHHTVAMTICSLFMHLVIWLSQIDQLQKHDLHTFRCPRIAYLAPCMTHFDAIVSRAVPLAFCITVACINATSNPIPKLWENYMLAQLANVFILPVSLLFAILMQLLGIQKVATVILLFSMMANYLITWLAYEFLVPSLIVYTDNLLDRLETLVKRYM